MLTGVALDTPAMDGLIILLWPQIQDFDEVYSHANEFKHVFVFQYC